MKFLKVILTFSLLLLVVPLLVVESSSPSSSPDNNSVNNITRGSSLSLNDTSPYWLSPSGNIAFGFYQSSWSPDRYVVGIWFVKSSEQTLVWTANPNDLPLHKPSSIHFTKEGKLMLRIMPDNEEKLLLPDVPEPVSYAKMQDNGNFVLYGSDSQIIWQSFDYPTDTILGGQKLRPGIHLTSGDYKLSVRQTDGFVGIHKYENDEYGEDVSVMSDALEGLLNTPVILGLDVTGKLYLGGSDGEDVKVFYKRKQPVNNEGGYIYRATLSSIGRLNLHKERIDGINRRDNPHQKSSSSIVWSSSHKTELTGDDVAPKKDLSSGDVILICVLIVCGVIGLVLIFAAIIKANNRGKEGPLQQV